MNELEKTIGKIIESQGIIFHNELINHGYSFVGFYNYGDGMFIHYQSENTVIVAERVALYGNNAVLDVFCYKERVDKS